MTITVFTAKGLRRYDARTLEKACEHTTADLRTSQVYKDATTEIIDLTMSCDLQEAIESVRAFMQNAIKIGTEQQDKEWKYHYCAAYDIYKHLIKRAPKRAR